MKNNSIKFLLTVSLVGLCLLFSAQATAQKKSNGGVIKLEVTTIEGRVQKPNAFFINTREGIVYKIMELKESFVGEIPKVVDGGDF